VIELLKELYRIVLYTVVMFGPLLIAAWLDEPLVFLVYIVHVMVIIIRMKHVKEHGYYQ
jgi:hypothetical protein